MMTREEALAVAVTALHYVLDNDTDYLERGAIEEFSEALTVLSTPEPGKCEACFKDRGDDPDFCDACRADMRNKRE